MVNATENKRAMKKIWSIGVEKRYNFTQGGKESLHQRTGV
jgi:hypothetical protein